MQFLIVLTTLATFAACSSVGGTRNHSDSNVSAQWDSAPLDQDYQNQRAALDARHNEEIANPRPDESSDQRAQRHSAENQDLEQRYAQGKASHARSLPSSSGQTHDQGQSDKSRQ